jgi:hypothetical protein
MVTMKIIIMKMMMITGIFTKKRNKQPKKKLEIFAQAFLESLPYLGLGIHSDEVQILPYHVHQAVQIPLLVCAHRAIVRELGYDV